MKQSGKVTMKSGKDFHGVTLWSFQVEGSRRYWRCGRDEPPIEEGQWIEFEESNGNVAMDTLKVTGSVSESATASPVPDARSSASTVGDVGARLRYQAARRDATRIVVAALHTNHLPHSDNTAKGKRLGLLEGYVEQVTKSLLEQEERNV